MYEVIIDTKLKSENPNDIIDSANHYCYEKLAFEYDSMEHSTCRNFDEANYVFLEHALKIISLEKPLSYLDVGVGTGISIESIETILANQGRSLEDVFSEIDVLDISKNMLKVTKGKFADRINNYLHTSIHNHTANKKYGLIVSTLADPFLTKDVFNKFQKLMKVDAHLILSFPSYGWTKAINRANRNETIFHNSEGEKLSSYSFCWSEKSILKILKKYNFELRRLDLIGLDKIKDLSDINRGVFGIPKERSFLTGVIAIKRK